jgi:hypothetical protein
LAEDRTPPGNEPRGEWETRLWIGIWCDRDAHRGDPPFRVEIDGIQMMETRSNCRDYERPPNSAPNAGFLGFTLSQGSHVLTVYGPEGIPYERDLTIADDTWVIVDYKAEDGVPNYSVRTRTVHLTVDATYNPATRPVRAIAADRGSDSRSGREELAPPAPSVLEDGSGSEETADSNAGTPGAPRGDSESEWISAGDSPSGSARSRSSHSGSSRGSPDDDGWVEGTPGYLSVESGRPARVYVDGAHVGEVPLRRHTLNSGSHRVILRGEGDFERRFNVTIESGRNYSLVNDR